MTTSTEVDTFKDSGCLRRLLGHPILPFKRASFTRVNGVARSRTHLSDGGTFAQTLNETEHLEYMESRGGSAYWVDRFVARHLVLVYYWVNVVYYWLSPRAAYHLSYEIELHAEDTYAKYLKYEDCDDKDIERIMLDENIMHKS